MVDGIAGEIKESDEPPTPEQLILVRDGDGYVVSDEVRRTNYIRPTVSTSVASVPVSSTPRCLLVRPLLIS